MEFRFSTSVAEIADEMNFFNKKSGILGVLRLYCRPKQIYANLRFMYNASLIAKTKAFKKM
jgi:hypothetical protein